MKRSTFWSTGSIWLCSLTVNRHITLLFDAAEQNLTAKSSFDPFPSISWQKAAVRRELLPSTAVVLGCATSNLHGDKARAAQGRDSCWHSPVPCVGLARLCPALLSARQSILAFTATQNSSSSCPECAPSEDKAQLGTGEIPAERMPCEGAWLWDCEPSEPPLPMASPEHVGHSCPRWRQQAPGSGRIPVPSGSDTKVSSCCSSPAPTSIRALTRFQWPRKAVLGTGSSQGWCAKLPSPPLSRKPGEKQKSWDAPAPALAGVGLSGVQFLSQKVLMMLHFFPPGYCENVGQCGMGRGTGSAHMLGSVSQPSSEAQSRQTPAHISHNKGQFGFIMKHSPLFSDWWLLQFFFFHIRYPSNVISFSRLFSSFNNKAGTEKQHYHYPFL